MSSLEVGLLCSNWALVAAVVFLGLRLELLSKRQTALVEFTLVVSRALREHLGLADNDDEEARNRRLQ